MDTRYMKLDRMIIRSSQMLSGRREELREKLEQNGGWAYVLSGNINAGELIALIPNTASGKWLLVSDTASGVLEVSDKQRMFFDGGNHAEIVLTNETVQKLLEILCRSSGMKLAHSENKSGRPPKYTPDDKKRIFEMRKQGISIREIAKKEKMSPTTVQKLEKEWQMYLFSVGGEQQKNP